MCGLRYVPAVCGAVRERREPGTMAQFDLPQKERQIPRGCLGNELEKINLRE